METIKKLLRNLLGVKHVVVSFSLKDLNYRRMFNDLGATEEFEAFLINKIIIKLNQRKPDDARVIDEVYGEFVKTREEMVKQFKELAEMTPLEQATSENRGVIPTQV